MNRYQPINVLQVQLVEMARLSQRVLDYSIKGYQLGSPEFSRSVRTTERELEQHHQRIKEICRKLATRKVTDSSDCRFVLIALRLSSALLTTSRAAVQIAQDTPSFFECSRMPKHAALCNLGDLVNSLMRLCIVALFKQELRYAEAVLQSQAVWRRCELVFDSMCEADHQTTDEQDIFEPAIARSLGTVARQTHDMADAILFWLKESDRELSFEANGHDTLNSLFLGSWIAAESLPRLPRLSLLN
ncbi:PhoU domain-containing protein [Tunturiibacter gelidiferens]|uniref:PhoU domain-containing protein n=1 Tax=Tunturiibacter gelidiferens TaxID=3069689 RepID=UPI003D9BC29B